MSVISLQCPSCNAKLKAKSSAVGQSLACPRCANMLVVGAPEAQTESPGSAGAERSMKAFESDSLDELLDQSSSAVAPIKSVSEKGKTNERKPRHPEDFQATMPAQSAGQFSDLHRVKTEPSDKTTGVKSSFAEKTPGSSKELSESKDVNLGPAAWQSQKARKRQAVLLGVTLGLGILLIGGAITYYFLTMPDVVVDKSNEKVANEPELQPESTEIQAGDSTEQDQRDDADPRGGTVPDPPGDDNPTDVPGTVGSDLNNPGIPDDQVATGEQDLVNSSLGKPSLDHPKVQDDPSAVDDDAVDKVGREEAPSRESFEDAINQIFNGDAVFQEQTLTGPQGGDDAGNSPFGEVLVEDRSVQRRRSARYERPAERLVDLQEQMTTTIAGIKNDQMQPMQLIQLMERLSSIPIWIDADALRARPVSLDQVLAVQAIKQDVSSVLTEQLAKFELTLKMNQFGLQVFPLGTAEQQTVDYSPPGIELSQRPTETSAEPVEEITQSESPLGNVEPQVPQQPAAGEPKMEPNQEVVELAAVVKQFVHAGHWQKAGENEETTIRSIVIDRDAISVVGPMETQFRIKRMLDQLNIAQSNEPTEEESAVLRPLAFSCEEKLAKLVRLDFYTPTPLRHLFNGFTTATGIHVIIDWPALIKEGWTPDTEVPWVANNETAAAVLDELTFDMGLTYQVVAADVIVLTSKDAVNNNLDVEVYPVSDLLAGLDQWPLLRSRLSQMLYVELNEYPNAYLNYYHDWKCVIAKLPQGGHKRLTEYFEKIRQIVQKVN